MNETTNLAKLVTPPVEQTTVLAKLTARPLRVAFLIRTDIQMKNFIRIIEYNSLIWGGVYNLLVPTEGTDLTTLWWENLLNFRPDIVVFCGDTGNQITSDELEREIVRKTQPFMMYQWKKWDYEMRDYDKHEHGYVDRLLKCAAVEFPLRFVADSRKEPLVAENSNVFVPEIDREHPYYPLVTAQVGIALGAYKNFYTEVFKSHVIEFPTSTSLNNYLERLGQLEQHFNPLSATALNTHMSYEIISPFFKTGLSLVIMDDNSIDDICFFWSLRLIEKPFSMGRDNKELILPARILRSANNVHTLCEAIKNNPAWNSRRIMLFSQSVSRQRLINLQERLQSELQGAVTVEIIKKKPHVAIFTIKSKEATQRIDIKDNRFVLEQVTPEFGEYKDMNNWAVDVEFNPSYELPLFLDLNHKLCNEPNNIQLENWGYWLRYSRGKFTYRANTKGAYYGGSMPRADIAFEGLFRDAGFQTTASEKRAYTEGFLNMLGSHEHLESEAIRLLLWELRKGNSGTYFQIKGKLLKGGMLPDKCPEVIDEFIKRSILLRGMEFRCERCGLNRWYPIDVISERMQCAGCLSLVQPPPNAQICFRLNELLIRAIEQGSIPVIMTESLIEGFSRNKALALYGIGFSDTSGNLVADADLVTTCNETLVLVECKEFKAQITNADIRKAVEQLTTLTDMAQKIGNAMVILSTLLPLEDSNTKKLATHVLRLNKRFKLPVHLACLRKMAFVDLNNPSEIIENPNLFHIWRS